MKALNEILPETSGYEIIGDKGVEVPDLFLDSRKVTPGSLFAAVRGHATDGHYYIKDALRNGAKIIILEDVQWADEDADVTWVVAQDSKELIAETANKFFDKPSEQLTVIGITGTNGKTSIAWMMHEALTEIGCQSGLISTISIRYGQEEEAAELTTPDVVSVMKVMAAMRDSGCTHVVMEASSHALHQGRLEGVDFDLAIFSNLTRDHLDYHGDMLSYLRAKKLLFDGLKKEAKALVNIDDRNGLTMVESTKAEVVTYSSRRIADHRLRVMDIDLNGMHLMYSGMDFFTRVTGRFNVMNVLAVIGGLIELGWNREEAITSVSAIKAPEGRLDLVKDKAGKTRAIVDYAHTPDAVDNVLKTIQELKEKDQKVVTVLGAGGNRDKGKRMPMARAAVKSSDTVILTSDNPRNEDPKQILEDMKEGLSKEEINKTISIEDRKEAIKLACKLAGEKDVVLIAGKGHEKYQEIKGERLPFDDKVEVYNYLYKES